MCIYTYTNAAASCLQMLLTFHSAADVFNVTNSHNTHNVKSREIYVKDFAFSILFGYLNNTISLSSL